MVEKRLKLSPETGRKFLNAFGYIMLFSTVAITIIDLWSHTNGTSIGLANLDRRKLLTEIIGPIAKNIGNYGFTAILSALAVFTKHIMIGLSDKQNIRSKAQFFMIFSMASIIALNGLVEDTESPNPEKWPDFSVALLAQAQAAGSAEFLVNKIKQVFRS